MTYEFINHNKHAIQISGPNREIIRILPGKRKILSDYFLRYCPKYLKTVKQFENSPKEQKAQKQRLIKRNVITQLKHKPKSIPKSVGSEVPTIANVGIGILSCNRLHCVKRLLESIKTYGSSNINVIVSDESTDQTVKEYLRSVDWITLLDNKERKGVVHNTNRLLNALIPYKFKMILNDDVEIKNSGWELFYFNIMKDTNYHHFCYREYNIYGANRHGEITSKVGSSNIKTITTKPQGAVLTFDDLAFKHVGYYDPKFPRYGMAHVDWSNRVSKSGIQPPGFHDADGSEKFFKIHAEKTVEEDKAGELKKAKLIYETLNRSGRMYVPPPEVYPSKIHLMINSYNRPHLLDLLLSDVEKNKSKHNISIYVYDDASEKDYKSIIEKHQNLNITYYRFPINHGKEEYWQIVTKEFANTKIDNSHYFIKIDDDVRLVDGFFDKCISYWNNISDPRKICLNPLLDELRKGKAVWTGKNPREVNFGPYSYWNSGWVDMMFFCEKRFFAEIDFKIDPIPKTRWIKDKTKSSGVGAQLSEKFTAAGLSMYQPGTTLVMHEEHKSQMHSDLRKSEPIISTTTSDKITISMASIKERAGMLNVVINSLYEQCDRLNVYLNDYDNIPSFLNRDKITIFNGKTLGNIGDIGKFYAPQADGYIFTVDDDLLYPPDYVSTMINKIEHYNRKCCIGVHGVILNDKMIDYYKSRRCFHYKMAQEKDVPVHIIGTGTLAYHSKTIMVCKENFNAPNMADIWFGILAQNKKVGLRCISKSEGWLKDMPGYNTNNSICGRKSTADQQTKTIKSFGKWTIY